MIIFITFVSLIVVFIWLLRILGNISSFAALWYIKEYRFDRMLIYLKTEGIASILLPRFRRPPIRFKVILLIIFTIIFFGFIFLLLPFSTFIRMIILDFSTFPIMSFFVFFLQVPTAIYHKMLIYTAEKKLRSHKSMIVIGITGSIGKTTTKEYLAEILGTTFNVLKTRESQNSVIGVAETIIKDLKPEHEVFVVEMAAYKKGEIAAIASLVKPHIGIVTAINQQHLDLFGSLENTMEAKYELIQSLPKTSIAIFNADNAYTRHMAERASREGKNIWMYTKEHNTLSFSDKNFVAKDISVGIGNISFLLMINNQKEHISVSLSGEHQVSTVLAALAGAVSAGMSIKEAATAASKIHSYRRTMDITRTKNGVILVDDTFNNNPEAAVAALQFLSHAKGKKILVFAPMIELGSYTEQAHKEVGSQAAKICDEIVLTSRTFSQFFIDGAKEAGFYKPITIAGGKDAAVYIQSLVKKDDVVLFKGKEAGKVLKIFDVSF